MIIRGQKAIFLRHLAVDKCDFAFALFDFQRTHDLVLRLPDYLISLIPLSLSLGPFLDCRVLLLLGRVHIEFMLIFELRVLLMAIVRVDISSTHHMAALICLLNLGKKF